MDDVYHSVIYTEDGPLDKEEAVAMIAGVFFDKKDPVTWQTLIDKGVIDKSLTKHIPDKNHELTLKEVYAISASIIDYVKEYTFDGAGE